MFLSLYKNRDRNKWFQKSYNKPYSFHTLLPHLVAYVRHWRNLHIIKKPNLHPSFAYVKYLYLCRCLYKTSDWRWFMHVKTISIELTFASYLETVTVRLLHFQDKNFVDCVWNWHCARVIVLGFSARAQIQKGLNYHRVKNIVSR